MSSDARLKQNFRAIRQYEVNGYKPFGIVSLFLLFVAVIGIAMGISMMGEGEIWIGLLVLIVGVACLALQVIRNLKLQSPWEIIKTSILQIIMCIFIAFFVLLWALDKGMEQARQQF